MASTIKHKRGDTIDWTGFYKINNIPVDLTNINIACQFKKENGTLVISPTITKLDQTSNPGKFNIKVLATATALFPIEKLKADIQYTDLSGSVVSTETFIVNIIQDITI